jgi:iron(III) transport system substrate-binding protein
MTVFKGIALALAGLLAGSVSAQDQVLNLYSSRHYQTDEALYSNFTKQTGIKINRIEGGEDPLIERIRNEGERSPADVLITVDAGRLWRAQQAGLFQPVKSAVLESRIPPTCASRAACGTASRRARA